MRSMEAHEESLRVMEAREESVRSVKANEELMEAHEKAGRLWSHGRDNHLLHWELKGRKKKPICINFP